MRTSYILPFAAVTAALVVPDQEMANRIASEPKNDVRPISSKFPSADAVIDQIKSKYSDAVEASGNALDDALSYVAETKNQAEDRFECLKTMTAFDAKAWMDSHVENSPLSSLRDSLPDMSSEESVWPMGGHHHRPHHPHHKPNLTVYELIAKSKYTTKLAKLINEDEDLVNTLNGTAANYTVFAPIDAAFDRIPDHGKKPSKEIIKKILLYHVSDDFYPAARVLVSHTIPSLLEEPSLGGERQRLRLGLTLKGLTANFYSRVVAINIFGTNGVIHGVDHLILPPPPVLKIVDLLPSEFSTLQLGLVKTGLFEGLEDAPHEGGTLFAPSNGAFQRLGPKINAFLFSKYGRKYLKALLEYHVVANQTLYSDAFYKSDSASVEGVPKGYYHVDLPTLLEDRHLSIDVARYGGFINIKVNGYINVGVEDGISKDGVIQVVNSVLIPPKQAAGSDSPAKEDDDANLTVEELKARLDPFIDSAQYAQMDLEEQQEL